MNIKRLYAMEGTDIPGAISRFMGNEEMYMSFLAELFTEDTTFADLETAVSSGDSKGAETAAHTLKGAAANMGLDTLSKAADDIVQAARAGNTGDIPALFDICRSEYGKIRALITEE